MSAPRRITVLGATGSIGRSTLDVIAQHPEAYRVECLVAAQDVDGLAELARAHSAKLAVIARGDRYAALRERLAGSGIAVAAGDAAVVEAAARPVDWLMSAIVGAAGLAPTLAAIAQGTTVALANKECLVCAGHLMIDAVQRHGATLLPVDSEHNAIFQALAGERDRRHVRRLVLTASGGPFREWSAEAMRRADPDVAAAHPNWSMGRKISIDSATMMNKGLELIEAAHLFALPEDRIAILVHPESIIHSMVDFVDGSTLAQLGEPDMRTPIAYALAYPARIATNCPSLDLTRYGQLRFFAPDTTRFPALRLAREALRRGGSAPTILNAANEVAVASYLQRQIGFLDIAAIVEDCLQRLDIADGLDLAATLAADTAARRAAQQRIEALARV